MTTHPNYLFLVHRLPYPPNRGDRIRSFHLLKHLASRGNVYLATLADEPVEPATRDVLNRLCTEVFVEPLPATRWMNAALSLATGKSATEGLFHSPALRKTVTRWAKTVRFDAVVVFCSSMVQYLSCGLQDVRTVVDLVDVDSQKFFDYAAKSSGLKRWLYRLEGQRLRTLERSLPRRVQAITLVSEAEAELYRGFCPNRRTFAVCNGVDLDYFQPVPGSTRSAQCVFVGVLDYPPNIDGVTWFCKNVWPLVRTRHPDALFTIVGRNPVPAVQQLESHPGVRVVASVPDVRPYLAEASAVVAPLRIARGVQNKVLEAMAMAKPVVVSPQAAEGLGAEPGIHYLQAQSTQEWVEILNRLFSDRELGSEVGRAGYDYVRSVHPWPVCLASFDHLIAADSSNHSLLALQS